MNFTFLPSSTVLIHSSSRMFVASTYNVLNDRCDLCSLWPRGSWVLGTKMGSKLLVTLGLVPLLHFLQRFANERTGRIKHPVTLGATEALKVLVFNPNQLPRHSRSISLSMCKMEQGPEA